MNGQYSMIHSSYGISLSIQFSLCRTPKFPKPKSTPLHMNLHLKSFAEINLAEQTFQRDCWTQYIISLWPIISTTSLALQHIVPTFHEDKHILHILHSWCGCWIMVWIELHITFYLPGTMPSLLDIAPLYNTICNFAWLDWGIKFTAGYPYWCKPVGRPGN